MSMKSSTPRLASALLLCLLCVAQIACGSTAHDFVQAKTGIDVGPEVRLCSNGVLHDDVQCHPNGTGGMPWVKNENFDIFSLPPGQFEDTAVVGAASQRYLGVPYWQGHLQPACKVSERDASPAANTAIDAINLAAKLDQEISRRFTVEAMANLRKTGMTVDFAVEAAFRERLTRLVRQKLRVRLVWFVTTYTGGRYAAENNPALSACVHEMQAHRSDGAQIVTGVAGFAVLQNDADVSINSTETIVEALRGVVADPMSVIDARLSSAWEKTVGNVIRVNASTTAMTQTVYPLWVQFE